MLLHQKEMEPKTQDGQHRQDRHVNSEKARERGTRDLLATPQNPSINGPTTGSTATISVPTLVAKYASAFHGNKYPVKPKARATPNKTTPVYHVSSRGGRYALRNSTLKRCTNSVKIIRLAAQA